MSQLPPSCTTVEKWIKDIPEMEFDGTKLRCNVCASVLPWATKAHVTEHVSTEEHRAHLRGDRSAKENQKIFNRDLVKMLASCNLPKNVLDNPALREFFENCLRGKYSNVTVPAESTLRLGYLSSAFEEIQAKTISDLHDKNIWVSVDETSDARGRNIALVLAGGMDERMPMPAQLISCTVLDTINSATLAKCVDDSLKKLWGTYLPGNKGRVLLYVTDGAVYMKASAEHLKNTYKYENLLHVTSLAHGLHRIAKCIRKYYPKIDKLISEVKKIFLKSPSRQKQFLDEFPNTPLPPQPVVTHWGTWLEAASYYYIYFEDVKRVIDKLNAVEAVTTLHAQQVFNDPSVREDLMNIHKHFSRISACIVQLENTTMSPEYSIIKQMNALLDLRHFIYQIPGCIAECVKNKFETALHDNPGFDTLCCIVDLLDGKEVDFSKTRVNVPSLKNYTYFKYAPVTSVDVERSFASYKSIISDRRLTPERLEQSLIINFNSQHH